MTKNLDSNFLRDKRMEQEAFQREAMLNLVKGYAVVGMKVFLACVWGSIFFVAGLADSLSGDTLFAAAKPHQFFIAGVYCFGLALVGKIKLPLVEKNKNPDDDDE